MEVEFQFWLNGPFDENTVKALVSWFGFISDNRPQVRELRFRSYSNDDFEYIKEIKYTSELTSYVDPAKQSVVSAEIVLVPNRWNPKDEIVLNLRIESEWERTRFGKEAALEPVIKISFPYISQSDIALLWVRVEPHEIEARYVNNARLLETAFWKAVKFLDASVARTSGHLGTDTPVSAISQFFRTTENLADDFLAVRKMVDVGLAPYSMLPLVELDDDNFMHYYGFSHEDNDYLRKLLSKSSQFVAGIDRDQLIELLKHCDDEFSAPPQRGIYFGHSPFLHRPATKQYLSALPTD